MKIDLSFAELHTPLFLGGINWGVKLDVKNTAKGKLVLAYDREEKELLVRSGSAVAIIPTSNVVSMTPKAESIQEPAPKAAVGRPPKAQASSPMDHVFQGNGAGKVNDK